MKSSLLGALGLALIVGLPACRSSEGEGVKRIGRYVFLPSEPGFEIREQTTLGRLLEIFMGRRGDPKIRIGPSASGANGFPPEAIAGVLVRRRPVRAPEIKSPFKRPFEARFFDADERELPPFFHFRSEKDAQDFANEARRRLSEMRLRVRGSETDPEAVVPDATARPAVPGLRPEADAPAPPEGS